MKTTSMTAVIALTAGLSAFGTVAFSQSLGADVSVGGVSAGVDAGVGGTGGTTAGVDANVGGTSGTTADVDANVGGAGGTAADVDATVGGTGGTTADVDATVGGAAGAAAGITADTDSVDASLNLGVGRLPADANLRMLDVNADALVNVNDDLNKDGVVDSVDVGIAVGNAGTAGAAGTANTGAANTGAAAGGPVSSSDGLSQLAAMDPAVLSASLAKISDDDMQVLKQECTSVLASAGTADAGVLAVCQAIAAL